MNRPTNDSQERLKGLGQEVSEDENDEDEEEEDNDQ